MNKNNIAIMNPDVTCCKCLEENTIKQIHIHSKGYGSGFDGWSTKINLCDICYGETNHEWWELRDAINTFSDDWYGDLPYEYENEIFEFMRNFSPAGREMVWNRYSTDSHAYWGPQDYIDYDLGILPHEKCKEYSVYSHQEIQAYKDQFPTCQHPVNVVYNDESKGCRCPFGAFGNYGQSVDINVSDECYECENYSSRVSPIKDISHEDYDDYTTYYVAKLRAEEYKSRFE